jgi:predicted acyltransferase
MKRFESLDVLRGMTIAAMILVNTPGSWSHVYPTLLHARWEGCTPTDLVFPFFLFIVGAAMAFSFKKYDFQLSPALTRKILKRTAIIFLIGLTLNVFPFYNKAFDSWRIMGVLQRIALGYGIGAFLVVGLSRRMLIIISAGILFFYWGLLNLAVDPYSLETNLVRKLDLLIFGDSHLYGGFGIRFDPEGLLSSLPAAVSVTLGYLVSQHIRDHAEKRLLIGQLAIIGFALIGLGWLWGQWFPIIKALWTSSYVLYTAGIATLCWMILIWIIDFKGIKRIFYFFKVYGMNALFAYVISILWVKILFIIKIDLKGELVNGYSWIYQAIMQPLFGDLNGSLAFAIFHIILFWIIIWILYRKRIFIKI